MSNTNNIGSLPLKRSHLKSFRCKPLRVLRILSVLLLFFHSVRAESTTLRNRSHDQHNEPSAEWTVMVFMNGDNNLEGAAIQDFQEMRNAGMSNSVNLVVQLDLIGKYQNMGCTQTLRFKVTSDKEPMP